MNFAYTLKLDLPLDEAWSTLMDIERIAPCMPGAKIESHDGDTYTGRLKVKLGPMELTYRGDIRFIERDDDAKRAVVDAQAKEIKGRGAAKSQITIAGASVEGGAEIHVESEFSVSGKAAQFGRGVMEEVGEKLMDDFARRLGEQVGGPAQDIAADDSSGNDGADTGVADVATATPAAAPPAAAPETPPAADEALDIGGAVWGPLLKRLALPGAVIVAALVAWWLL
jgi:carbon monoxide dehydrogenase subunit G